MALFLDGKRLAEDELVIAVGVTVTGQKQVLGFATHRQTLLGSRMTSP